MVSVEDKHHVYLFTLASVSSDEACDVSSILDVWLSSLTVAARVSIQAKKVWVRAHRTCVESLSPRPSLSWFPWCTRPILCSSPIVSQSHCVPVPLRPSSILSQDHCVLVPLCPRSILSQSYCVPVPLCPSLIVSQFHWVPVPSCTRPS